MYITNHERYNEMYIPYAKHWQCMTSSVYRVSFCMFAIVLNPKPLRIKAAICVLCRQYMFVVGS